MKINWKDLALVYILWIVMAMLGALVLLFFQATPVFGLILRILLLIIPIGFYFYRNQCELNDAVVLSAVFGFTVIPVFFFIVIIPLAITESFIFTSPNFIALIPGINFSALLLELLVNGFLSSVLSILSFFGVKYLKSTHSNKKVQKIDRKDKRD